MSSFGLLFVVYFISVCLGQDTCNPYDNTNCGNCTSHEGCGWCSATGLCLTGTLAAPKDARCGPKTWYFGNTVGGQHSCPNCAQFSSCTGCTDVDACGWNAATGLCVNAGSLGASPFCPCSNYSQCTDCQRGGCVFCSANGLCFDANPAPPVEKCPLVLHGACTCSAINNCEICAMQEDICQWCSSTGTCMMDQQEKECSSGLTEQCGSTSTWNGGTFFGGIVLGLILTLLVLGGLYAYRTYGANQYQAVG